MNNITVTPCILNADNSSEKDLKGENLINDWKIFMKGYDEFFINCSASTINDLASTVN